MWDKEDKGDKNAKKSSTDEQPDKSGNEDEKSKRRRRSRSKQKEKEIKEYEKLKQKIEMYYKKRLNEDSEKSSTSSQSTRLVSRKLETVDEDVRKVPLEPKIINSELNHIKVDVVQDISEETSTKGEIRRDIVDPEEITVERRKDEGMKPIFDRPEVRFFDQIQRERENEIFKQKQVFVRELKKLVKLLFPDEHSGMSVNRRRSRSNSGDRRNRNHSPQSHSTSKSSVVSEKLESVNEYKSPGESEITTNGETVKSSELQNDVSEEGSLSKREGSAMFVMLDEWQKEIDGRREGTTISSEIKRDDSFDEIPLKKQKVDETKPPHDREEIKLLDEWQEEIDARRLACLKQLERGRSRWRSRSRSRSLSPYYRSKTHGSISKSSSILEDLTREEMLYREYRDISRERHERRRASELAHYMDRIPIPAYYDTMPLRMMPMRSPSIRSIFPVGPRLPFPARIMHPGMRAQIFPPGT